MQEFIHDLDIEQTSRFGVYEDLAQDTEQSRAVLYGMFQSMQNYAAEHGGSYMEVHKVGDSYVPLVALVDTAGWGTPDEGLGYVTEDSGHTLAEIYYDCSRYTEDDYIYMSSRVKQTQADLENLNVPAFIVATKLGVDRKTLCYRGRIEKTEAGQYLFSTRQDFNLRKEEDKAGLAGTVAGLARLGIHTQLFDKNAVVEIGYSDSTKINKVVTDVEYAWLPNDERSHRGSRLGVLTGITVKDGAVYRTNDAGEFVETSETVEMQWTEGSANRHGILYRAKSKEENCWLNLPIGDDTVRLSARYDEMKNDQTQSRELTVFFMLECTTEQLERCAGDLAKIVQETERSLHGALVETTLIYHEPGDEQWRDASLVLDRT